MPDNEKDDRERRTINIQYMSDLHLERVKYQFHIEAAAEFLLLAGDIGQLTDFERYRTFIAECCTKFEKVFLLCGNHEYYGSSPAEVRSLLDQLLQDPAIGSKLVYLHRGKRYDFPDSDVTILGSTLNSHITSDTTSKLAFMRYQDFQRITDWTVAQHNHEHKEDLAYFVRELSQIGSERRVVIATHYAPSFKGTCHPAHDGSDLSECFASNALQTVQSYQGAKSITHWIFGHTHWNASFKSGGARILSNQFCNDGSNLKLSWWQRKTLYRPFNPTAVINV